MKKSKRFLAILLAILIICGGVIGVSAAVRKTTSGGKVMVISAEELNYGYGYWDSESMEGYVTSDRTQNVTLNTSQTVSEVKVTEGQEVKKGDVLLVYDMKQTEINLEKAELKLEQLKQSLKNAEEGLKKLKNMSPSSGDNADEADEPDDDEEEDEKEKKAIKPPKATLTLTGNSKPYYYNSSEAPAPGTEENPYRFLVKAGATVNADFINMVKKLQGQNQMTIEWKNQPNPNQMTTEWKNQPNPNQSANSGPAFVQNGSHSNGNSNNGNGGNAAQQNRR